jgi:hypothetical protein
MLSLVFCERFVANQGFVLVGFNAFATERLAARKSTFVLEAQK